jgi:hypothetical protein
MQPYALIVAAQARRAYQRFVGQDVASQSWRDAFLQDPRGAISPRLLDRFLGARVTTDELGRQSRREVKELYAQSLREERAERGKPATYDEAKERYARHATNFFLLAPQRQALEGRPDVSMLQFSGQMADEAYGIRVPARDARETLAGIESMFRFLESDSARLIAFIDLESSILASLEFDEFSREYRPSDFFDVETWSAYLPYVDVAVADRQMTGVLNRRELAAGFQSQVLPGTEAGLQQLVRQLAVPD